jgi:M6 family metalloprotease-like protein
VKISEQIRSHIRQSSALFRLIFLLAILFSSGIAQERLHIAIIRVEFQEDQNDLTTGDGRFLLDATEVPPFIIDPPPHNRSYFEDHLIAVNNYFRAASAGQLEITGHVFPAEQNNAYQLARPMAFYSPDGSEEENDLGLATLFVDAIEIADQDAIIDFSLFDLIVIIHAGVGKDIDLGFDPTPQDIPSLYISPDFLKRSFGDTFDGIPVDGASLLIDRGIVLPETESQEDIQASITGIFAANIGSHLGLYDLFSPSDETSGIGSFGLMDNGLFNVVGLIPALPNAFSRILAGWESAVEITQPAQNLPVSRLGSNGQRDTTVYRIPLNSDEYFLLEYRGDRAINIDSVLSVLAEGRQEFPSYLEVLQTYIPDKINVSDSTGVLLSVDDYDVGLPGAGILIWHIDESVIAQKGKTNTINDDPKWRAVDLEEADGSQDIGFSYSILEAGFQSEFGTLLDFWFSNNPAPLYQNEFSSRSAPNSRSNRNRAFSNIILKDFSTNSNDIMTFSFDRDFYQIGYPRHLGEGTFLSFGGATVPAGESIFTADQDGKIFGINPQGTGILGYQQLQAAQFSQSEQPFLALADTNQDAVNDLIIATGKSGQIELFKFVDADSDSLLDTLVTVQLADSISTAAVVKSPYFFVGSESGNVYRFTLNGALDSIYVFTHPVRGLAVDQDINPLVSVSPNGSSVLDLDSDGAYEIIEWDGADQLVIQDDQEQNRYSLAATPLASPIFADLDINGFFDIIFSTSAQIFVLTHTGTLAPNMPLTLPLASDEFLVGAPVVFDVDGDERSDIIVISNYGQIFGYSINGQILPGFPLTIGGTVNNTVTVSAYDDDQRVELFAINDNGLLYAWEFNNGSVDDVTSWRQESFNFTNNRFIEQKLVPAPLDAISLLPTGRVFNYPNPNTADYTTIRYFLRENARVSIKIFDLAGDLVTSFNGPGTGQTFNEVRWQVNSVSSGIYLCRVEAVSASNSDSQLIKIMVVN